MTYDTEDLTAIAAFIDGLNDLLSKFQDQHLSLQSGIIIYMDGEALGQVVYSPDVSGYVFLPK